MLISIVHRLTAALEWAYREEHACRSFSKNNVPVTRASIAVRLRNFADLPLVTFTRTTWQERGLLQFQGI
jgi:hypothetical protein